MTANMSLLVVVLMVASMLTVMASRESELLCRPLEVESGSEVTCTIHVRNSQREPTTHFVPSDFHVRILSSSRDALVEASPLLDGPTPATAVFTVTANTGTNVTVIVSFVGGDGTSGKENGAIRRSGVTLSILTTPASYIGALLCSPVSAVGGLTLRDTVRCTAALADDAGRPATLSESDVVFSETNMAGEFNFVSGRRNLVFNFRAPNTVSSAITEVGLTVGIRGSNTSNSVSFPLLYPELPPDGPSSILRCFTAVWPVMCTIVAADAVGPVYFRASDFIISIDVLRNSTISGSENGAEEWVPNLEDFDTDIIAKPTPSESWVSWSLKQNDAVNPQRFRVFTRSGSEEDAGGWLRELQGSPFHFRSGLAPTVSTVLFRGCTESVIAVGNSTRCVAELKEGVSGDVRYLTAVSALHAAITEMRYEEKETTCQCRAIVFTYTAPNVKTRSDDFIVVSVGGAAFSDAPFRMNVFPVVARETNDGHSYNTAIIAMGFPFYGAVLIVGFALILHRSRKISRIRARKEAQDIEMAAAAAEPEAPAVVSNTSVAQQRAHQDSD